MNEPDPVPGSDAATAGAAAGAVLLGSLALTPVYASGAWFPPVALVVLVVLAGGVLLRWAGPAAWIRLSGGRPAPPALHAAAAPLVALAQLGLVGCVLTALFAPERAFAGLVPTWSSVRDLGTVFADGSAEIKEQAVPALPLHGLVALTVLLLGLIAVAVDLVAVAGQQPALAGLGLLVVFCVPIATIKGGIGLVGVLAPAVGLGLLLWADQRRRLARRTSGRRSALGAAGLPALRIGALALALGLGGGLLIPTLAEGTFTSGPAIAGGPGGDVGTSLDPVAVLHGQLTRPDPVNLLRVQASVSDPGYLRAVSLDQYDPQHGWTLGSLNGETSLADSERLAALPAREQSRSVNARITVLGLRDRFLPVLTSPLRVTIRDPQQWRFDPTTGTVFARGTTSSGTYQVSASEPRPSVALLQSSPPLAAGNPLLQRYTELPPMPGTVTDLVRSLTAKATTPYGRVRAILDYFTDPATGFTYSLSTAPGTSGDHLVDFLQNKQGYCEQYAGAMAAMVRAAGVPARVALGYTPGTQQPNGGGRVISTNDAHAWVEVYFADLGWVPFDPTPVSDARAVALPWAPRLGSADTSPLADSAATAAAPSQSVPTRGLDRADQAIPTLRTASQTSPWLRPLLIGLGALLVLTALVAFPGAARIAQRRRRLADGSPGALWDELMATARDLGVRLAPSWTPRQTARELAELMAGAAVGTDGRRVRRPDDGTDGIEAVRRLALAEEAASYAPPGGTRAPAHLAPELLAARRALATVPPARRRLRALLWPGSLTGELGERWRQRLRGARSALPRRSTRPV